MCNNKALLLLVGNIQQIGVNQIFLLVFAIFPSWALFLRVSPVKHFLRDSAVLVHRSNRLRRRITTCNIKGHVFLVSIVFDVLMGVFTLTKIFNNTRASSVFPFRYL